MVGELWQVVQPVFRKSCRPARLPVRERVEVSVQEVVETIARPQRPLKGGEGAGGVSEGDRLRLARERRGEGLTVFRCRAEGGLHGGRVRHRHLDGIQERPLGLLLEGPGPPVPELGDVVAGVLHARRVPRPLLSLRPVRRFFPVGPGRAFRRPAGGSRCRTGCRSPRGASRRRAPCRGRRAAACRTRRRASSPGGRRASPSPARRGPCVWSGRRSVPAPSCRRKRRARAAATAARRRKRVMRADSRRVAPKRFPTPRRDSYDGPMPRTWLRRGLVAGALVLAALVLRLTLLPARARSRHGRGRRARCRRGDRRREPGRDGEVATARHAEPGGRRAGRAPRRAQGRAREEGDRPREDRRRGRPRPAQAGGDVARRGRGRRARSVPGRGPGDARSRDGASGSRGTRSSRSDSSRRRRPKPA